MTTLTSLAVPVHVLLILVPVHQSLWETTTIVSQEMWGHIASILYTCLTPLGW